jgi:hypothetical protein
MCRLFQQVRLREIRSWCKKASSLCPTEPISERPGLKWAGLRRSWHLLLQKYFWGVERKFLEPLMRFTRGDVRGPYRFIQNRSPTSVVASKGYASAEKSKDQFSRRLLGLLDFRLSQQYPLKSGRRQAAPACRFCLFYPSCAFRLGHRLRSIPSLRWRRTAFDRSSGGGCTPST